MSPRIFFRHVFTDRPMAKPRRGQMLGRTVEGLQPESPASLSAHRTQFPMALLLGIYLTLHCLAASAAGTLMWSATLKKYYPYNIGYLYSNSYPTKAQAIAAMKTLDPTNYAGGESVLQETAVSSETAGTVTYKYTAPPAAPFQGQWYGPNGTTFPWVYSWTGTTFPYNDEASATASYPYNTDSGTCGPLNSPTISTVPAGD